VITWLNPTPHKLVVYASAAPLPVAPATLTTRRLARPYLGGTFPRWIALASAQRTPASNRNQRPRTHAVPSTEHLLQHARVIRANTIELLESTLTRHSWPVRNPAAPLPMTITSRGGGSRVPLPNGEAERAESHPERTSIPAAIDRFHHWVGLARELPLRFFSSRPGHLAVWEEEGSPNFRHPCLSMTGFPE
jgi:hypothetical protein